MIVERRYRLHRALAWGPRPCQQDERDGEGAWGTDATIRGHVFASFLALVLMRELQDRMDQRGWQEAEWADVLRDLNRLSETEFEMADGKRYVIRGQVKGWAGKAFQAAGVAVPPTLRQVGNGATIEG